MTKKELEDYILLLPQTRLDYPFGEDVAVYKVGPTGEDKMFALISESKYPANISLKCDPLLAETLRDKYVSVMPGYHLNKKHWNTIITSGEVPDDEIKSLIDHSYQLVTGKNLY
jgi:predicted DNA-binding protein (MmcQ/YjbR family)